VSNKYKPSRYKQKSSLDKFYTNPEVAKILIAKVNLVDYELIIEPSAGSGSFSKQIPNCLAFDIDPQAEEIICQDFLKWQYNGPIEKSKILCIGNPPFGKQSTLAVKFFLHCSNIAGTIAFILPLTFRKASIQNRLPLSFHLINEYPIPTKSFTLLGDPYEVPSVFQIWKESDVKREKVITPAPLGYRYVKPEEADLAVRRVGFYAGTTETNLENKLIQCHYFLKIEKKEMIGKTVDYLNSYKWEYNNTVGPRSISKLELNSVLNILFNG
jgi:hypothetical protein